MKKLLKRLFHTTENNLIIGGTHNHYYLGSKCKHKCNYLFNYSLGKAERKNKMLELKLTNEQKILVTVNPVTEAGNPVAIDGSVTVTVQSGDSRFLVDATNAFYLISSDTPGITNYIIQADADLGEGVETITDMIVLSVEGAKAINLGLVADAPELK